jgi:hypothetical protein
MLALLEWIVGAAAFFFPEWLFFWLEDEDRSAYVGTIVAFVATGALLSLLLSLTSWPVWVNWTVGFAIALLYFVAVFCFSSWWIAHGQKARRR